MKMNVYYDSSFGQETSKTTSRNHWDKQIKKRKEVDKVLLEGFSALHAAYWI